MNGSQEIGIELRWRPVSRSMAEAKSDGEFLVVLVTEIIEKLNLESTY